MTGFFRNTCSQNNERKGLISEQAFLNIKFSLKKQNKKFC